MLYACPWQLFCPTVCAELILEMACAHSTFIWEVIYSSFAQEENTCFMEEEFVEK